MKQEQSNTFTEGLVQDLNPINTPETVLTDNLNGTIITYDGNEYSLQNDRGNYPLQYCRLKPNYIPVGVKEYADTLYIVSYNPLDNTTEIGSYPSPLEISSSIDNGDNINLPSLIQQSKKNPEYTKLMQSSQLYVFSDDELKLYPGDEYQIKLKDESKYIYEELEYYIIDENRNKYNITEHIKENCDFAPAGWTVPGWMAVQYRIAVFEDFQMNVRSFIVPTLAYDSEGKLKLNFQLKISDKIFLNRLYQNEQVRNLDEIGLRVTIRNNDKTQYSEDLLFSDINGNFVEWYEASKILWAQNEFRLTELSQGDKITIEAIPFIQVHVDESTYRVNYDNFAENLNISLTNIGSFDDFTLAEDNWKFWIEEDDDENLYLEFDVKGPIITSDAINLYYSISHIGEALSKNYQKLESYNGIGQNMILIKFDDKLNFVKEGMYIIDFVFAEENPSTININKNNSKSIKKLVIASQIFSSFVKDVNDFENITFDEWVSKYPETIKNADRWGVSINGGDVPLKTYSKGDFNTEGIIELDVPEHLQDFWKSESYKNRYDHTAFITEDEWTDTIGEHTDFLRGYTTNADVIINTELEVLNGPLWDKMERFISIDLTSHGDKLTTIPYNIGNNVFSTKINPIVAKTCSVTYDRISQLVRGSESRQNEYQSTKNDLKFAYVMGKTRHDGSNNYIECWFKGFGPSLNSYAASTMPKNVGNTKIEELGNKSKVPNTLTGKISDFMSTNNLPFCIIFIFSRGVSDKSSCQVFSGENKLADTPDNYCSMQPFIAFKNKQGNPLFFSIDGYDFIGPKKCELTNSDKDHGFNFAEYFDLDRFVKNIKSKIGDLVKYHLYEITDGYFIQCKYDVNDTPILNLETSINIPTIKKWNIGKYNLLNALDREALASDLKEIGIGNLLRGVTSELKAIDVAGLQYNQIKDESSFSDIDYEIDKLLEKLDSLNNIVNKQFTDWRTDELFNTDNDEVSGVITISSDKTNDSAVQTFKQSDLYKLIQKSITSDDISLSASGEKLLFKNSKDKDSDYCMGLIHTSIKFP